MKFNEDFIQYIWKHQLLRIQELQLIDGTPITIIHQGQHNYYSGPDFKNAKVSIEQTDWHGSIEIHLKSSDWYKHHHEQDANYENVILHVVYEHDLKNDDPLVIKIPHLELKGKIPLKYLRAYESHVGQRSSHPCHPNLDKIRSIDKRMWLHRMSIERLEKKKEGIDKLLKEYKNDWEQVATITIGRYFGMRKNNDNFEVLLRTLPVMIIHKNKDSSHKIESLLFGLSGMLSSEKKDSYSTQLVQEYKHQKKKYNLREDHTLNWNFMKMRPANFPSIRLSQLSQLLVKSNGLMASIIEIKNIKDLESFFQVNASEYWNTHYVFDKESTSTSVKKTGKSLITNIILNAVIPLLFTHAKIKRDDTLSERALQFLEELKAEKNAIVSKWKEAGLRANSAGESLGLVHLTETYCKTFRCLDCTIGHKLISK